MNNLLRGLVAVFEGLVVLSALFMLTALAFLAWADPETDIIRLVLMLALASGLLLWVFSAAWKNNDHPQ